MNKRILYLALFLFSIVGIYSCDTKKVEPDPNRLGYDFFPLETGSFVVYDIDETVYTLSSDPVTHTYQVKEVVAEEFTDLSNETAFQLMRYYRKDTLSAWDLDSVWIAKRTPNQAIRTENNTSFVKLVFPLKEKQTWNGNVLNNLGKEEYLEQHLNKPYVLPKQQFSNTITVFQKTDTLSIVGQDKRLEVYAQGVGLIYKEKVQVHYCQSSAACLGKGQIDFGTIFYQRLNSYGKN